MKATLPLAIVLGISLLFTACKEEKEDLQIAAATDFYPTQVGKFITYRLDSMVFTQQGRREEMHVYQQKDVVDAAITDGQGRPSYRVYRFLRDSAGTQPWYSAGTYIVTPSLGSIEVQDNNMRTVRLISPVKKDQTWKGGRFLGTEPYSSAFLFSNDDDIGDWDYTISQTGETVQLNGKTYTDVVTVDQVDESFNVPVTAPGSFASRSFSRDKFAKGLGLIYQEYI
ncbi:MAG: hypothetical protein JWP88_1059, partial [Flaviaesturariibacter sp.]|nr:hypothetical protein [Flaviaesturariibacter sp.]